MFIITLLVLASITPCFAQGNVKVGSYNMEGYDGAYIALTDGRASWYHRQEIHGGAGLNIGRYRLSEHAGVILRIDSPTSGSIVRFGGWLTDKQYGKVEVVGASGKPLRADIYSAPVKLADSLTLDGWAHLEQGKKPDFWVGPSVKLDKDIQLYYRQNLRSSGSWVAGADFTVMKW